MSWQTMSFESLYAVPSRNGVSVAKNQHDGDTKIVNMGELFASDFIGDIPMRRIKVEQRQLSANALGVGDLLFARRSLVASGAGKVSMVSDLKEPTVFESSIIRVRLDQTKALPRFYAYWFRSPDGIDAISRLVTGTNVKGIRGSELRSVQVPTPALDEQRRIASILMAYDNLIENNRRQIALLEEAADLTYANWLDACDRSSFSTGAMSNFFDVTIGKTPPRAHIECFVDEGVPWVSVKDLGNTAGPYISSTSECLTDEAIENYKVKVKPAGTILLSFKLTIGRVAIAKQPTATNEAIAHFFTDSDAMRLYTYEYLRNFDYDTLGSTSSIGKAINSKIVKAIPFSLPRESDLNQLYSRLNPLFCAMRLYQSRASLLVEARNRLLPKLMSGEIEV